MTYPKNELFVKHGIYSIEDLIKDYYRKSDGHFFDKGSMKFFNCKLSDSVYPGQSVIYFITSEKFVSHMSGYSEPRMYTLRSYNPTNGSIETVGEFQAYKSKATAARHAIKLLMLEDQTGDNSDSSNNN